MSWRRRTSEAAKLAKHGGGEIGRVEFLEAGAAETEFCGGLDDAELPGAKAPQDIAHKRGSVPSVKLLVVFIRTRGPVPRRKRSAENNASGFDRTAT